MLKDYFILFKKSWEGFRKNIVLYIPFLLEGLTTIFALLILGAIELGIFSLFIDINEKIFIDSEIFNAALTKIFSNPFAVIFLLLFFIIDIVALVFISSFFGAMKIGMYKEVINKKKTSTNFMLYYGKKYFKIKLKILLMVAAIFLIPFITFAILIGIFFLISAGFGMAITTFLGLIFGLYVFVAGVLVHFGLFFVNPVIVSQDKDIYQIIRHTLNFTKKNLDKLVITWAIVFVFSLVVRGILYISESPFGVLNLPQYALLFALFIAGAKFIIQSGVGIITDLFIFNVYFKK